MTLLVYEYLIEIALLTLNARIAGTAGTQCNKYKKSRSPFVMFLLIRFPW
jgi:hypothetical protein